jgi:Domain of unknown function (DUF4136)
MKKIAGLLVIITLAGCAREPEVVDLVKYMVVETRYDVDKINEDQNVFKDYSTFVLREDTLGFVSTYSGSDTILLDEAGTRIDFVASTIERVAEHVTDRGFTRVEEEGHPDFAVKIVVLENFSFFQTVSYPGYYSGYYGYYGGYYGPIVNTYSSNFVTMVIEVVDIKNFLENDSKYQVVWSAYIGDLLTTDDRKNKILVALDQAFEQSPYISKD